MRSSWPGSHVGASGGWLGLMSGCPRDGEVAAVASAFGGRRREPFAPAGRYGGRYGVAVSSPRTRDLRLTYCGNVHAANDLDAWLQGLRTCTAAVAAHARARGRAFGIGSWWPAHLAARLCTDAAAFARARDE